MRDGRETTPDILYRVRAIWRGETVRQLEYLRPLTDDERDQITRVIADVFPGVSVAFDVIPYARSASAQFAAILPPT